MDIFEANRAAWNEALEYHQKARNNALQNGFRDPAFTTLDRDCDDVLLQKLKGYDFAGKTIAQLPCNNGRELLSLMRLGARQGIGFDISDNAIAEARQLANISGLNAVFERTNILEIASRYNVCFDFIYISAPSNGSPTWVNISPWWAGCSSRVVLCLSLRCIPLPISLRTALTPPSQIFPPSLHTLRRDPTAMPTAWTMLEAYRTRLRHATGLCIPSRIFWAPLSKTALPSKPLKNTTWRWLIMPGRACLTNFP